MKRTFLILPALYLTFLFGCDSDRRTAQSEGYQENGLAENEYIEDDEFRKDAPGTNELERTAANPNVLGEDARQFVIEAALSSMAEIELGQLAEDKAQQQEVKDFARMLVEDHRQLNEELQNSIQNNPITMPEFLRAKQQEKLQELRNTSTQEFDKKYISMVVEAHQEDIDTFEGIRDKVQDAELQSWIDSTLTSLRQHLEQAKQIEEQLQNQ